MYRVGDRSSGSRVSQSRLDPIFNPFIILATCVLEMSYLLLRLPRGELGERIR